jgi:single-strand DNA-binding protein
MAEGLNRVMLLGNLGADPELKVTQGGQALLKLRLATTENYLDKNNTRQERTEWHSVTMWGKRGEALAKFLTKGERIFVEGRLQTSSYEKDGEKRYRTEIIATNLILGGGRGKSGGDQPYEGGGGGGERRAPAAPRRDAPAAAAPADPAFDDYGGDPGGGDDIPF